MRKVDNGGGAFVDHSNVDANVDRASQLHEQIELLAYQLWEERGQPWGSPEVDWLQAESQLTLVEPESLMSKVAREVGTVVGHAMAFLSDLAPSSPEPSPEPEIKPA